MGVKRGKNCLRAQHCHEFSGKMIKCSCCCPFFLHVFPVRSNTRGWHGAAWMGLLHLLLQDSIPEDNPTSSSWAALGHSAVTFLCPFPSCSALGFPGIWDCQWCNANLSPTHLPQYPQREFSKGSPPKQITHNQSLSWAQPFQPANKLRKGNVEQLFQSISTKKATPRVIFPALFSHFLTGTAAAAVEVRRKASPRALWYVGKCS